MSQTVSLPEGRMIFFWRPTASLPGHLSWIPFEFVWCVTPIAGRRFELDFQQTIGNQHRIFQVSGIMITQ